VLSLWGLYERPHKDVPLIGCKEFAAQYENEPVVTSDGLTCRLDVMICYRIVDAGKALFEVEDYERALVSMIRAVSAAGGGQTAGEWAAGFREQLAGALRSALDRDVAPWGIKVRLVEITEIRVPATETNNRRDPFGGG